MVVRDASMSEIDLPAMDGVTIAPLPLAPEAIPGGRVLLADDDADLREYLSRILEKRWTVEAVSGGTAALAAARLNRPDVILADVLMPGMDGLQLLRELRADPRLRATPVILLSARAGSDDRVEGLEAGADDYLVKPFSARELLARVSTHMQLARYRAESESSRANLMAILERAPVGIALFKGETHRFALANPAHCEMVGRPMEELIGRSIFDVFPHHVPPLDEVYRSGRPMVKREFPGKVLLPDGRLEEQFLTFAAAPMRDADGNVIGVMTISFDATEQVRNRRRLETTRAEAEEANRAKDEFLAMLGHELRNPLTPILATMEHLRLRGTKSLLKERQLIERHARQVAGMVDDLLDIHRIARGKVRLARTRTELSSLVSQSLEAVRPILEERRHALEVAVPHGLLVNVDPGRLVQVISNLLTNAAKYTDRRGLIQIRGARESRSVVFRVRDDGVGIPADLLPRIFDPFTQGARGSDRTQGGLGLGLSIVRSLVERHGGTVAVSSGGPGRGSEFTVRLPLARPARARAAAGSWTASSRKLAGRGQAILLVDDNRDIAIVLGRLLQARGHAVEIAHDGPGALEIARRFRPRFALLDIGLPAMDGYELARRLKKQLGPGPLVLVAVTGYGQQADRERARKAGFREHLVKPIDLERLLTILER
jgi:PAS domain S-box-containing protein